jgi:hypothetical protein
MADLQIMDQTLAAQRQDGPGPHPDIFVFASRRTSSLCLPPLCAFLHADRRLQTRKALGIKEFWCGRQSTHATAVSNDADSTVRPAIPTTQSPSASGGLRGITRKPSKQAGLSAEHAEEARNPSEAPSVSSERDGQASGPSGLYERFRGGLLTDHSDVSVPDIDRQRGADSYSTSESMSYTLTLWGADDRYTKSLREAECLQSYHDYIAEVWRLTYATPAPTSHRTFVVLILSRELVSEPVGERSFMNSRFPPCLMFAPVPTPARFWCPSENQRDGTERRGLMARPVSIPFDHPNTPEKQDGEKNRVRGRYISVERVREINGGREVEWEMATSSDAGGTRLLSHAECLLMTYRQHPEISHQHLAAL